MGNVCLITAFPGSKLSLIILNAADVSLDLCLEIMLALISDVCDMKTKLVGYSLSVFLVLMVMSRLTITACLGVVKRRLMILQLPAVSDAASLDTN